MTFYLLGVQREDIPAVVIAAYKVTDERETLVWAGGSKEEAERKAAAYRERFPQHRFYVSEG